MGIQPINGIPDVSNITQMMENVQPIQGAIIQ
jgi:hypothetical protein